MRRIKVFLLALIIVLIAISNATAFLNTSSLPRVNYRPHHDTHSWRTNRDIKNNDSQIMTMLPPIGPIFDVTIAEAIENTGILVSIEQNHEAQFYGDMAHLLLDYLTFCIEADGIAIQFLIFLGRVFSILSDYVPDHTITFDELIFQLTMLSVSIKMILEKVYTTLSSLNAATSFKDKRIYKTMFFPAGFTWIQYKTLLSSNALQWVDYDPGMRISYNNILSITYKGEIEQVDNGTKFTKRYGVIGDLSQVHRFSESSSERPKLLKNLFDNYKNDDFIKNQQECDLDHEQQCTLCAGEEGLTLLQIDMKKLFKHGSEDAKIFESTKNLYFNAMQKALVSYPEEEYPPITSAFPLYGTNHGGNVTNVE